MAKNPAAAFDPDGQLDADSLKMLSKALSAGEKGTFTYLEFRIAANKLIGRGLSPEDAYESVYTTAETLGVDRKHLLKSAQNYQQILDSEKAKFAEALERRLSEGMDADRAKIEKLDEQLDKLEQQVRDVQAKVEEGKATREKLAAELASARERISERGERFDETYKSLRDAVEADFEAMKRSL